MGWRTEFTNSLDFTQYYCVTVNIYRSNTGLRIY